MKIALPVLAAIIFLSSCQKDLSLKEASIDQAVTSEATLANEFSNCKLRRIVHQHPDELYDVNGLFTYNAAGNPYSLTYSGLSPTQNFYFYYDKKNRLKELLRNLNETEFDGFSEKHRYGYDANDVIVTDTVLFFDVYQEKFTVARVVHISYDSQGRVAKEITEFSVVSTTRTRTYTYDARGNLGIPGWKSSGYDNKVSIFRAHPLFQFIHRNYSRNNARPEVRYNSSGLPLVVMELNDNFFGAFYRQQPVGTDFYIGGIKKAIYDCQ